MNADQFRTPSWLFLAAAFILISGCKAQPGQETVERGSAAFPSVAANDGHEEPAEVAGPVPPEDALPTDAVPRPVADEELADGWIALFDGHSLFGWTAQSKANWRVEDGAIVVDSGERGLLTTNTQFGDYALRLEFQADPQTNSGVFLHTPPAIGPEGVARECYELNIAPPDNPFPTGSFVQRLKAEGGAARRVANVRSDAGRREGGGRARRQYRPRIRRPRAAARGHIGLQFNEGKVTFRNIRLKPLGRSRSSMERT
jgi:hypothetical protein